MLWIALLATTSFGQWLPESEQQRLRALWPNGVSIPKGLKFYRLTPAYQNLVVMNGRDYRAFHSANQDRNNSLPIWLTPGGLTFSDRREWRNAVGLAIPEGSAIEWWLESIAVPNAPRDLPALRWSFPNGTIAVDMLTHAGEDGERCFELRTREKHDGTWDAGIAYRPFTSVADLADAKRSDYVMDVSGTSALNVSEVRYTVWDVGRVTSTPRRRFVPSQLVPNRFAPSRVVVRDEDDTLSPRGYLGPGLACIKCHEQAGEILGYGSMLRGGDTVLSWHPIRPDSVTYGPVGSEPQLDERWPLRQKAN
jgi:hypothetical protein